MVAEKKENNMFRKKEKTKLKTWHLVAFGIIILFFLILKIYGLFVDEIKIRKIEINGLPISVIVADTPESRYRGLSGIDLTETRQGMLFVFPNIDYHTFVMREMDYAIDIIWIKNGEIVEIAPNVVPEKGVAEQHLMRYRPRLPANYVLEVPAGFVEQNNIKIGDMVKL